ncbi:MAG TPA: phosphatase PAP2 family protein [Flavitalea sp.]|nr:phosphatase PAP2 family protein [Flavitalea sp.]
MRGAEYNEVMRPNIRKKIKKFFAAISLLSTQLIIILILFVIALFAFVFLVYWIIKENRVGFDFAVFKLIEPHITNVRTGIMNSISFLGAHSFLIPANLILIAYFLFIKKRRWYSIKIPVVSLGSLLVMMGLKRFFSRPRPDNPILREVSNFSFPSGHAMVSFTFYGLLIYLVWQNVRNLWLRWILVISLVCLIIAIGVSRIYLRYHYATDVLAGFCLGLIWLVISIAVITRIEKYTRKEIAPIVEEKKVPSVV